MKNRDIAGAARHLFRLAALATAILAVLIVGATDASSGQLVIGYVTKSATNQGWILINQGAADAAKAQGVDLITVGPAEAGSLSEQLAAIEDMISRHVKALAVAPVDSSGVAPAVKRAEAAGIPVIAIDTAVYGAPVTSFAATDNPAAGVAQGQWVARHVPPKGEVILVNGLLAQSTGRDRHDGFLKGFRALRPQATVYEVQTKWDQTQAQDGVEALLRAHPKVSVIANAWDGGTMGTIAALKALYKKAGQVTVVGFDGAPDALQQMELGWVQADVAQHLYKEGYDGVMAAIEAAKGAHVSARIDTGNSLVTPANVKQFIADNHLERFMTR